MKKHDENESASSEIDTEFRDLVDYIRENKTDYGLEKLRKGLLQQGVDYADIRSAIQFIEDEEEQKIAGILDENDNDDDDGFDSNSILEADIGGSKTEVFRRKADKLIGTISTSVGGSKKLGKIYVDVFKYGAISFLFFSVVVYFFKLLGGIYVYPRLTAGLGDLSRLAVPGVFLTQFDIWYLLLVLIWSLILGGILVTLFIKYLSKVWPFSNWFKLQQKLFVFFALYEFIISIVINGIISSLSWTHLVGYLIIMIGIGLGAYLASNYLAIVLENKYEDKIRHLIR